MTQGLSGGEIRVNDVLIAVVSNSVMRKYGRGETKVVNQSLGNGINDPVHYVDNESAKSMFKFSMLATKANIELIDSWKKNVGLNSVRYYVEDLFETYEQMSVTNDPEYPDSSDGKIEVEFQGKSLVA
jgi:hypothetical protein